MRRDVEINNISGKPADPDVPESKSTAAELVVDEEGA
jgi:hypothetical protein